MGQRIREAREEKGMTQQDIAAHIGMSRAGVAQWESDTTSPSIQTIAEVAKLLHVTPSWLAFGFTGEAEVIKEPPEGTIAVPEVVFGETATDRTVTRQWPVYRDWLLTELHAPAVDAVIMWRNDAEDLAPRYGYGELVFVDTSSVRPSSGNATFLVMDQGGPALRDVRVLPGPPGQTTYKVTAGEVSFDVDQKHLIIVGRARGTLKRTG